MNVIGDFSSRFKARDMNSNATAQFRMLREYMIELSYIISQKLRDIHTVEIKVVSRSALYYSTLRNRRNGLHSSSVSLGSPPRDTWRY